MSNETKTAVQILVDGLIIFGYLHSNEYGQSPKVIELINQAKEIEKQQIMEAHYAPKYGCFSEEYYNETYGGGTK
jgi:fumarate reductase subunit C